MPKKLLLYGAGLLLLVLVIAGIRIGLLLLSISGNRTYWQHEAAITPPKNAITYIALGDSTAQGIGASNPRRGYVGLVADYIARQSGRPVHVINISVSGAKVADAIKTQLPQLPRLPRADYITIEIGANDMPQYNRAKFTEQFTDLIKQLPNHTLIATMPSFNGGRAQKLDPNARDATEVIKQLTASRPDLKLVDLYSATNQQNLFDVGADLFHPSNKGYKNWARAFIEQISKNTLAK